MSKNKKKKNTWVLKRHQRITRTADFLLRKHLIKKYGFTPVDFPDINNRNYLILYNHQTGWDQCLFGLCFNKAIYYVATEDIFSIKFVSPIIKYLVNPIPIKKSMTDTRAVMNCIKVAKEGGSIAIAPEGNRTFSGKTENMKDAISKLAKALKLPIAFYIFEGGYGVLPRWADKVRKGKMTGSVKYILEYDDYKDLSNEELYEIIKKNLYHDDNKVEGTYESKNKAEYLERLVYVCPHCGLSEFESHGDDITCKKCGMKLTYTNTLTFDNEEHNPEFKNVNEWYEYQNNYINNLELKENKKYYEDNVRLFKVIVYKKKVKINNNCKLELYNDKYIINSKEYKFDDITATSVLGKNKINIYYNDEVYQIKGEKSFNAVKYVNIYYRYKNIKENNNEQFLGL